jgi:FdhD protein
MKTPIKSKTQVPVWLVENGRKRLKEDQLTTEEPLEIRLTPASHTLAITVRTPGADFELAAGFLFSEGVISNKQDIQKMSYCTDESVDGEQRYNIINVQLKQGLNLNLQPLERHFYINSACGVCGKANIEGLRLRGYSKITSDLTVQPEIIYSLSEQLRSHQGIFSATGGLHAAAVFDAQGKLLNVQEDVGRHNALDKLIGNALLSDELPFNNHIVMVSGRSSFEILQKSVVAKVPIVCSVSAPSSLAVSVAQEFGITLIGFLREERFNIYTGWERLNISS